MYYSKNFLCNNYICNDYLLEQKSLLGHYPPFYFKWEKASWSWAEL